MLYDLDMLSMKNGSNNKDNLSRRVIRVGKGEKLIVTINTDKDNKGLEGDLGGGVGGLSRGGETAEGTIEFPRSMYSTALARGILK
jgi:hypothetical protein